MFEKASAKPVVKFLIWERLLDLIDCDDDVINSLKSYIYSKYIVSTDIGKGGLKLMNSESIPKILESIWGAIDKLKDSLYSLGLEPKRTSQFRLFYGFSVSYQWGDLWTGFSHAVWMNHKTPFYVQFRTDWLKSDVEDVDSKLKGLGFQFDDELK
ncbi:MAG: hypothetical protein ACE5GU_00595 [Candidatus Scalinduaceae bacterium]